MTEPRPNKRGRGLLEVTSEGSYRLRRNRDGVLHDPEKVKESAFSEELKTLLANRKAASGKGSGPKGPSRGPSAKGGGPKGKPPDVRNEIEVEFDLDNGKPANIAPVAAPPPPSRPQSPAPRSEAMVASRPGASAAASLARSATSRPGFHNPYNFIPSPSRKDSKHPDLGDHPPGGHHVLAADRLTGWIDVELETATPLLLPDAARAVIERSGHKKFPVRLGPDGLPYIAPTAIKGMLSSAYEAATNSRMRVFHKHQGRLAYRMAAKEGLGLVPARINGSHIELMLGTTPDLPTRSGSNYWQIPQSRMYAAWLGMYAPHARNWGPLAAHGRKVWAYVTPWEHRNPNFQFWNVAELVDGDDGDDGDAPKPTHQPRDQRRPWQKASPLTNAGGQWVLGYVCITHQNINRKHDERVFFVGDHHPLSHNLRIPMPMENGVNVLARAWRDLIQSYQDAHEDKAVWGRRGGGGRPASPEEYLGGEPGKTAWSRHVILDGKPRRDSSRTPQTDARALQSGDLCYARVERVRGQLRVVGLYPVMIARELFSMSPEECLDASLRPARIMDDLSPADRVFGWVSADAEATARRHKEKGLPGQAPVGYRGQLRIGQVTCQTPDCIDRHGEGGVPLAILSTPKPAQAGFYSAHSNGNPVEHKNSGYQATQILRGRKVYPHHRHVAGKDHAGYWEEPLNDRTQDAALAAQHGQSHQEYRRPHKPEMETVQDDRNRPVQQARRNAEGTFMLKSGGEHEQRDDQNRSMLGWVKVGARFRFRVHVTNLSKVELGALLWILSLNQSPDSLQPSAPQPEFFHRLGGGKPLGFGSVTLSVAASDLRTGAQWAEFYGTLEDLPAASQGSLRAEAVQAFRDAVVEAYLPGRKFTGVTFIAGLLAAARGFASGAIHYPRTSSAPDPNGENFKWFGNGSNAKYLPLLTEDPETLPYA
jgi:CRISPR-associated protein (TIGR03986 family)